jgi:hypothetical protein
MFYNATITHIIRNPQNRNESDNMINNILSNKCERVTNIGNSPVGLWFTNDIWGKIRIRQQKRMSPSAAAKQHS